MAVSAVARVTGSCRTAESIVVWHFVGRLPSRSSSSSSRNRWNPARMPTPGQCSHNGAAAHANGTCKCCLAFDWSPGCCRRPPWCGRRHAAHWHSAASPPAAAGTPSPCARASAARTVAGDLADPDGSCTHETESQSLGARWCCHRRRRQPPHRGLYL